MIYEDMFFVRLSPFQGLVLDLASCLKRKKSYLTPEIMMERISVLVSNRKATFLVLNWKFPPFLIGVLHLAINKLSMNHLKTSPKGLHAKSKGIIDRHIGSARCRSAGSN